MSATASLAYMEGKEGRADGTMPGVSDYADDVAEAAVDEVHYGPLEGNMGPRLEGPYSLLHDDIPLRDIPRPGIPRPGMQRPGMSGTAMKIGRRGPGMGNEWNGGRGLLRESKDMNVDQYEARRLQLMREYELKRLQTLAESKYGVKMNLRGRTKLEHWLGSDQVTNRATNFIVAMFSLDHRVLSPNADDRRVSLLNMRNEDLRILEALMLRVTNRSGHANWAQLTSSFTTQTFGEKLQFSPSNA